MTEYTISQLIAWSAENFKDKSALCFPAENIGMDFITLQRETDLVSKALLGIGLKKGEHIGIWSTNSSRWILLALSAAQIGVVFVPVNAAYQSEELSYIVRNMDVNYLFVMTQLHGKTCVDRLEVLYRNGRINGEEFPALREVYFMSDDSGKGFTDKELCDKKIPDKEFSDNEWKNWDAFIGCASRVSDEQLEKAKALVTGRDIYSMQCTSGTTAMPKGARLYQNGVLYTANCYAELLHLDESDITCVPLPLFHCFGNVLTLLGGLISGSTTIYMGAFSASGMLKLLKEEKCTCMLGVPTMFTAMLAQPNFDSSAYSIKKAGMGGSYCPPALAYAIKENFHCQGMTVGYGLSEVASLVTLSDIYAPEHSRLNTVGKPLSDFEVSLYDEATGQISQTLEQGEIICRGLGIMKDYYNNAEETSKAIDADGWLHTGDLGSFDEDGYLRVVGRIKDIIVRGGENISPSQIEALLLELDEIRDVQCVGVPDKIHGEEVAAFVILKEKCQMSEEAVKSYVAAHLASYKVPKYVFFTECFPMNAAGKVMKQELSKIAEERIKK